MNPLESVNYLILHHTGRNNDFPLFAKLRHVVIRGWDDIGYHYLIGNQRPFTEDGKVYPGRPETFEGAHARGYNHCSLGICLIGDLDKTLPSERQLRTLHAFLEQKMSEYGVPPEHVLGHRELPDVTKTCPGRLMNMSYLRATLFNEFSMDVYLASLGDLTQDGKIY